MIFLVAYFTVKLCNFWNVYRKSVVVYVDFRRWILKLYWYDKDYKKHLFSHCIWEKLFSIFLPVKVQKIFKIMILNYMIVNVDFRLPFLNTEALLFLFFNFINITIIRGKFIFFLTAIRPPMQVHAFKFLLIIFWNMLFSIKIFIPHFY